MSQKHVTPEELKALLDEQLKDYDEQMDRLLASTKVNTERLINKPRMKFFAVQNCGVCGKPTYYNRLELMQLESNQMYIAANVLNQAVGFSFDIEEYNVVCEKLRTETDEAIKKSLLEKKAKLDNFYFVHFLCNDCGLYFQTEFRKIFDKKVEKEGVKCFI